MEQELQRVEIKPEYHLPDLEPCPECGKAPTLYMDKWECLVACEECGRLGDNCYYAVWDYLGGGVNEKITKALRILDPDWLNWSLYHARRRAVEMWNDNRAPRV